MEASTGGGKIVTLPAGTVGKAGDPKTPDVKTTGPVGRIVDVPVKPQLQVRTDKRDPVILKTNNSPPQFGRSQVLPGKVSGVGGNNSNPHFAQSMNQGQGRRGFMH